MSNYESVTPAQAAETPEPDGWQYFRQRALNRDWLGDIQNSFPAWQRPEHIDPMGELGFALASRRHVATHLSSPQYPPGLFKIISGEQVDSAIRQFYSYFPAGDNSPETRARKLEFQDPYLETARSLQPNYDEITIATQVWFDLVAKEKRGQATTSACRGQFAVIVGFGMAFYGTELTPDMRYD